MNDHQQKILRALAALLFVSVLISQLRPNSLNRAKYQRTGLDRLRDNVHDLDAIVNENLLPAHVVAALRSPWTTVYAVVSTLSTIATAAFALYSFFHG